jgi:hypothetical protein
VLHQSNRPGESLILSLSLILSDSHGICGQNLKKGKNNKTKYEMGKDIDIKKAPPTRGNGFLSTYVCVY